MSKTTTTTTPAGLDRGLVAVCAVVVLGAVMSILDTTVVNVAIPALADDLGASLPTVQWIATGYLLALATVIPLTGWAADRFGTKRLFMASIALFLAGSALAGAAWSADSLIAFRVLQGLGGGMILPAGITLVGHAAGPQRMGRTMSLIGVPMLLGPILGPVLGGWLVDDVSWRWIFLVNLPLGALVLALAARVLPADRPQPAQRLDWRGLALLSPGLAALVLGLAETAADGGVAAPRAFAPMVAGAALIGAFVVHAHRMPAASDAVGAAGAEDAAVAGSAGGAKPARRPVQPLLDLRLLRVRAVAASAVTLLLLGGAFLGALFLLPPYLQLVRGERALASGLLLIPQGAGAALAMGLSGRLVDRIGARRVVLAGLVPFAAGTAALTQLTASTSYVALGAALVAFGLGMGATMMPAMTAAFAALDRASTSRATALLTIVQRVGSSIGVAVAAVLVSDGLGGSSGAGAVAAAGGPGAAATAFADAFWWPFALVLAALPAAALLGDRPRDR